MGDIILSINGEPAEQRSPSCQSSRPCPLRSPLIHLSFPTALRGAQRQHRSCCASKVSQGQIREIELTRTVALGSFQTPEAFLYPSCARLRSIKHSSNGYGYIDLARLPLADAHQALDAVMNTPAIIFDMRGYPNGTAWPIAPRLTEKKNFTIALFRRPIQSAREPSRTNRARSAPDHAFEQQLPPAKQGPSIKAKS